MRRALQLAKCGEGRVSPNPMVGAVITANGRIIGEGYHRHWGGPHAEVNAIRSVAEKDRHLLHEATIYVTLEPCSHYGKTPPCSQLIIDMGIPHVVVATLDPFEKVSGRGVAMLRDNGITVETGLLRDEAIRLNKAFITAHTLHRPYITLKWAQTANGYIGSAPYRQRLIISNPLSMVLMHQTRAHYDAIFVGSNTLRLDNPRLDCRLAPGRTPAAATFEDALKDSNANILDGRKLLLRKHGESLAEFLHRIYASDSITSLLMEGGRQTLQEFIDAGIYDEVRIETSPFPLKDKEGVKAPEIDLSDMTEISNFNCNGNIIRIFQH